VGNFLWNFAMLSLFMGGLILLVRFFSLTIGRKIHASTRYLLWVLILLRLCVPVLFPVPAIVEIPVGDVERYHYVERITHPDGSADTSIIPFTEYHTRVKQGVYGTIEESAKLADNTLQIIGIDLAVILSVVWLIGAVVYLLWNLGGYSLVMLRFRHTFVPAPTSLNEQAHTLGTVRGMKWIPAVYTSDMVHSPMLCGFLRPIIVVPRIELTENETAGVLAHELTHYKRGDLWIQLFGMLVCAMHWFNPAVHLADRWMREEMELSCDEAVLSGQGEDVRSVYGNGMLTILRQCRKRSVPMTTHFSPRLRMMQARFENIMDTRQKKRGVLWIAVVLVLCVLAGSAVACVQEKVVETVYPTNLTTANIQYDENGELLQIDIDTKGYGIAIVPPGYNNPYAGNGKTYLPVFGNGSLLTDMNNDTGHPAYREEGSDTWMVDVMAVLLTLYPDAGYGLEGAMDSPGGPWTVDFSYRIDRKTHEVRFRYPDKQVILDGKEMDMPFTMVYSSARNAWEILVSAEDAALLLGAEYAYYNAGPTSIIGEDGKPHLYYPFGEPFYLANQPHLVFWRYPKSVPVITEEEALDKLEAKLIQAYEATYGTFVPLEEEPAYSPYPGDDVMFRWKIPHLEVASETDRFYRIPFVWDFLVDKYTGDVIVHYNGESQTFHRFNPESPGALAFAG